MLSRRRQYIASCRCGNLFLYLSQSQRTGCARQSLCQNKKSVICPALRVSVAGRTAFTGRPPHRSVQARLRTWLLRRMGGVEASFWIGICALWAVQCKQTTVWAARRIMSREGVGQSLQGQVRFILRMKSQNRNNLDCSAGAFSARRRGLGIFAVAALTRLQNKSVHVLLDPNCGMAGGRAAPNSIR